MRVTKAIVPEVGGDGGKGVVRRGCGDGVEIAIVITSEDHPPRSSILDREANIVKLNVNRVVTS